MKKHLIIVDTNNIESINKIKKEFLNGAITIIPKGYFEIWEIDEENHMERLI